MHPSAVTLFASVQDAAHGTLRHEDTVRDIIFGLIPEHEQILQKLGFNAKFLSRTWDVMRRLGRDDPARDQLKTVYTQELETTKAMLADSTSHMAEDRGNALQRKFLINESTAFTSLLELLRDLAWIQNVRLDRRA
jgi:hypothetical protein